MIIIINILKINHLEIYLLTVIINGVAFKAI
jgi:hypothetical protein